MMIPPKGHLESLSNLIQKAIGYRIFGCFILAFFVVLFMGLSEFYNSIRSMEKNIERECNSITSFAVGQIFLDNEMAIQPKLDRLNKRPKAMQIFWQKTLDKKQSLNTIQFSFPLSWRYIYPVRYNDGEPMGYFLVKGSFFYEYRPLLLFLLKVFALLLFFIAIFIVLLPLSKKIPQKLFIAPIHHLLSLLRNEEKASFVIPSEEIAEISHKITLLLSEAEQRSRESALGQIAARVAHDIRSPLATMNVLVSEISPKISEKESSILRQAIQNMQEMTNNLLNQYKGSECSKVNPNLKTCEDDANIERYFLLCSLIEITLSQKRYEWSNHPCDIQWHIEPNQKMNWIFASPGEIRRLLSNLLNNAYEALGDKRQITLNLSQCEAFFKLSLQDTGMGIHENQLALVLEGKSYKDWGYGLGLSSAKQTMESLGGTLELKSIVNQGTEVTLFFPIKANPAWFPTQMIFPKDATVLILEDDISMHNLWRHYIYPAKPMHFIKSDDLLLWMDQHPESIEKAIFLMDYELKDDQRSGLEVLEQIKPEKRGYLITSHAEEVSIQKRCVDLGIWLIPKVLLTQILAGK